MIDLHTVRIPDGSTGTGLSDKLTYAPNFNDTFPVYTATLGTVGAVTAGTLYGYCPVVTPTGGTVTAATGWPALIRTTLKAVAVTIVNGGTSGWTTTNGTAALVLPYGIVLNVTAAAGNVISAVTINQAGSFVGPQAALGTNGTTISPVSYGSTFTPGVGTPTFTISYGLNTATIDDSGNYSVIPTGFSVARDSRDAAGSAAAVAAGAVTVLGAPTFYQVGPWLNGDGPTYPNYTGVGTATGGVTVCLNGKGYGPTANQGTGNATVGTPYGYYISFALYPPGYNGAALVGVPAGTLDSFILG